MERNEKIPLITKKIDEKQRAQLDTLHKNQEEIRKSYELNKQLLAPISSSR